MTEHRLKPFHIELLHLRLLFHGVELIDKSCNGQTQTIHGRSQEWRLSLLLAFQPKTLKKGEQRHLQWAAWRGFDGVPLMAIAGLVAITHCFRPATHAAAMVGGWSARLFCSPGAIDAAGVIVSLLQSLKCMTLITSFITLDIAADCYTFSWLALP